MAENQEKKSFLSYVRTLGFSTTGLRRVERFASWRNAFIALLASALFLSIPTDLATASLVSSLKSIAVVFTGIAALLFVSLAVSRLLGSQKMAREFVPAGAVATAMSLFIVSLPAAILGFIFFSWLLHDNSAATLFFSMIPFYNFVFFGWLCEELSGHKKWKGAFIGLLAASLLLAFYLNLGALTA